MPLWHCGKCCHEWEGSIDSKFCSWCNAEGFVLAEKTSLEKMMEGIDKCLEKLNVLNVLKKRK